jgi:rhodanese-related sulfurtransferase
LWQSRAGQYNLLEETCPKGDRGSAAWVLMKLITAEELKAKLDRGDDFKLVMTLGEWAYRAKHIPGSLNYLTPEEAKENLKLDEEIVVYCSTVTCIASQTAYHMLVNAGYENVRRYAGGIEEWEDLGYPMEGEMVD